MCTDPLGWAPGHLSLNPSMGWEQFSSVPGVQGLAACLWESSKLTKDAEAQMKRKHMILILSRTERTSEF